MIFQQNFLIWIKLIKMKKIKIRIYVLSHSSLRSPQKLEVGTNGRYASISLASAGAGRAALHTQVSQNELFSLPGWAKELFPFNDGRGQYFIKDDQMAK